MKTGSRFSILAAAMIAGFPATAVVGQDSMDRSGFVEVIEIIPMIILDIRYYGEHNFIGQPIEGYHAPRSFLTREAALALKEVQDELSTMSLSLKIYDAYRPQRAVDHFVAWARDLSDTKMKDENYPDVEKRHLFRDGYIAARSGHSRGSTLDLTIVSLPPQKEGEFLSAQLLDCRSPAAQRHLDSSLDMGTGYDCFDTLSWTADKRVNPQQRANRLLLKTIMEKHGFHNYEREWWHFTYTDEPFPETYFDFPVE